MLIFRYLMAVSAGVFVSLILATSTNAQNPSPSSEGESQPTENNNPQLLTPEEIQKVTYPENIDPSGNPLLFPTKPEEVQTNIVPITLDQAIDIALKNNKTLQAARLTLERSRAQLREAVAAQFPTINANVNFSYSQSVQAAQQNEQITRNNEQLPQENERLFNRLIENGFNPTQAQSFLSGEQGFVDETGSAVDGSIELEYSLYSGGRVSANLAASEKQVRSDQLEVEVNAQETRFLATRDYYNLQNADAQVAIEQARVEDAAQTLRDAQLLEQAGLGTRFDVLQAEVQLANANQALTRAIADQRQARRQLAQTLSIAQQIDLAAADEITEAGRWNLSLEESIVLAYKNRAELEQQLLQKEINLEQREAALADIRPRVSLFANYSFLDEFNDSLPYTDGYAFGTRLRWTLFDGGAAQARAEQQSRNAEIAETNFANQRNQIRLDVETAYFDLIANQENISTSQKAIETASESLRLARLRFQAGVGTQTDVINSQTDLTTARGNFLRAIIGYNQALNALQRAVSNLPNNNLFEFQ